MIVAENPNTHFYSPESALRVGMVTQPGPDKARLFRQDLAGGICAEPDSCTVTGVGKALNSAMEASEIAMPDGAVIRGLCLMEMEVSGRIDVQKAARVGVGPELAGYFDNQE